MDIWSECHSYIFFKQFAGVSCYQLKAPQTGCLASLWSLQERMHAVSEPISRRLHCAPVSTSLRWGPTFYINWLLGFAQYSSYCCLSSLPLFLTNSRGFLFLGSLDVVTYCGTCFYDELGRTITTVDSHCVPRILYIWFRLEKASLSSLRLHIPRWSFHNCQPFESERRPCCRKIGSLSDRRPRMGWGG